MKVLAKTGTKVPVEGKPREYILDGTAQEVPETAYYLRLIEDGSLTRVEDTPQKGDKK